MHRLSMILILMGLLLIRPLPTRADACPNAPLPRLRIGMIAVVAPTINRLNLRALPAVGTGVVAVLEPGDIMTVIDGPSCNRPYNWWRVELADGARGWIAEGTWDEFFVGPLTDQFTPVDPYVWSCRVGVIARVCRVP